MASLFRVLGNIEQDVGIALNDKIETMCISDSGLPNIVRLIVFFGTKRRVAQILYQSVYLFICRFAYHLGHFHQCAMILHSWLCSHFSNARLIALPEEKEPSTLPAFISRKPARTPLESLDFFLVSVRTRAGKSASRFVVTCLSSLTSSSSARRRFSNTAVVMRSVYQIEPILPREVGEGFVGLGLYSLRKFFTEIPACLIILVIKLRPKSPGCIGTSVLFFVKGLYSFTWLPLYPAILNPALSRRRSTSRAARIGRRLMP